MDFPEQKSTVSGLNEEEQKHVPVESNEKNNLENVSESESDPENDGEKIIKFQQTSFNLKDSQSATILIPPADKCIQKCEQIIDQIKFWSNFDSGNMKSVSKAKDGIFKVQIANDLQDREPKLLNNKFKKNWFYFKVENLKDEQRTIIIAITNLSTKSCSKIWQNNSDIYIKTKEENEKPKWKAYPILKLENNATLIRVTFSLDLKPNQLIKVAFCQPWSYLHNQRYFNKLQNSLQNRPDIYFFREILTYSREGNNIELVTLTGVNSQQNELESHYGDKEILFPAKKDRPAKFDKKYIFVSCRVHAGETPGSFMMKGMINFILSELGKPFLEHFVLILIPMLNPDGVFRGHQRLDSLGYDENRVYNRLYKKNKFLGPYAVLETAKYYDRDQRIDTYIDLHAHGNIPGAFLFYNKTTDQQKMIDILALPYLMGYHIPFFIHKNANGAKLRPRRKLIAEELEGELAENEKLVEDELDWHPSKIHLKQMTEPQPTHIQQTYKYVPGFNGIAKLDVFLSTSINKCYTLESNYKYGFIKVAKDTKVKLGTEEFLMVGESLAKSLMECYNLRGENSILPAKGFENIDSLRNLISTKL